MSGEMTAQQWPDGRPVTPWADPWHDIAADLRQVARDEAKKPLVVLCPHSLLVCPWCHFGRPLPPELET